MQGLTFLLQDGRKILLIPRYLDPDDYEEIVTILSQRYPLTRQKLTPLQNMLIYGFGAAALAFMVFV